MSRLARGAGRLVLAAIILAVPAMCRAILQAPQALAATGLAPASSKAAGEAGPARLPAPADLAAVEVDARAAAHAEEARRLAETLARVRRLREARLAAAARAAPNPVARAGDGDGLPSSPGATLAMAPSQLPPVGKGEGRAAPAAAGEAELAPRRLQDMRVTVLMRLAPGSYGIRRGSLAADPILCLPDGCYISEGAEQPARFLPGRRALGIGNTWGARAGACRGQLLCVFRGVDLGRLPGYLQPIDLHILKHDRRQGLLVPTDSACGLSGRDLVCHAGVYADGYALWIVPEDLAVAVGPAALRRALFEGLGEEPRLSAGRPLP